MPASNSVPPLTIGPNGVVLPAESAILSGVQADINNAFGGGVNPDLRTPQGMIAQTQTAVIGDKNNQIAYMVNMFDPELSVGRWQDGLSRIYFLDRIPARSTAVTVTVSGATGKTIPVGAQAIDTSGNIYICTAAVTIPAGGSISAQFAAVVPGATPCPANTLNRIYQAVDGWDSINNPTDGVTGRNVETASEMEVRRKETVAANGVNSIQSIAGNIAKVPNLLDYYCIQNDTDASVTIGTVTLVKHSIWVSVSGGAAADIADVIWRKKPPGTNMNGTTTFVVYDERYEDPKPEYTIKWNTATDTAIKFAVEITDSIDLPPDAETLVKNAILGAFNGADGGPVARIGSRINAGRYYAPVTAAATPGSVINIESILLGISTPTLTSVLMGINQKPTLIAANITVTRV